MPALKGKAHYAIKTLYSLLLFPKLLSWVVISKSSREVEKTDILMHTKFPFKHSNVIKAIRNIDSCTVFGDSRATLDRLLKIR